MMQQEKQDDEARWKRLCDDNSLKETEEFDIDDYREEPIVEDERDGGEAEPSQTLDIPDDESEPEVPSNVRTSRRRKDAGDAEGKTRTTRLRRTSRTSYQTEKAQGDEYLRYIGKYRRKERQTRETTRTRKSRGPAAAYSCRIPEPDLSNEWDDGSEGDDEGDDTGGRGTWNQ
jgi:hypothetical protein